MHQNDLRFQNTLQVHKKSWKAGFTALVGALEMAQFWFGSNATLQVLPGVYFGHLEPPNVSRLPASGRIVPWYFGVVSLVVFC